MTSKFKCGLANDVARGCTALCLCLLAMLACQTALAQSNAEWIGLKSKCGLPSGLAYNDWVAEGSPCPNNSGASTTSSGGSSVPNAVQTFINSYNKAQADAKARQQQMLNNANAAADANGAANAQNSEQNENAIQASELARHQADAAAQQGNQTAEFNSQYNSANQLLNGNSGSLQVSSGTGGSAQKAWQQLHCMAYLSGIAFDDLALGDITDYHDIRAEASKAADGSQTDAACPKTPPMPDLRGKGTVILTGVEQKLSGDLEQADAIAARMQKSAYQPGMTPPATTTSDPQLAAMMQTQRALSAINGAKNSCTTQGDCEQFEKDRKSLAKDIQDGQNVQTGNFGSIHVDLGQGAPGGPSAQVTGQAGSATQ